MRPGSADIADQLNGIYIKANASETLIGGNTATEGNVVAGFSNTGILIDTDSDGVDVADNLIGTIDGVTGFMAPGTTTGAEYGVFVSGEPQALNDATPIQEVSSDDITIRDNTIGSIGGAGVSAAGNTDNLVVRANHIGAAVDAAAILPIGQSGVIVEARGSTPVAATGARITDNVIGRSSIAGIELAGVGTTGVVVQGNSIGMEPPGSVGGGNSVGVLVRDGASDNLIGVPVGDDPSPLGSCGSGDACNEIVNNFVAGVWIGTGEAVRPGATAPAGSGNTVRGNRIARNVGLGIDLGDLGPTANDASPTSIDVDAGPNGLLNAPVAVSGGNQGGSLTVSGMVMSEDLSNLTIDVYEYGIFEERDLDDLFGTRTLRAGARYDTDLPAWVIPAPSATSATAYPQPVRWVGTVRSADIDPRSRRFRFTYGSSSESRARTYVAVVTDASGNTSEASSACIGTARPTYPLAQRDFYDVDQDALCDEWEAFGLDVDRDGDDDWTARSAAGVAAGKDVYVEVDAVDNRQVAGSNFEEVAPYESAMRQVVDAFRNAPTGPGQPGPIRLHLPPAPAGIQRDDFIPDPTGDLSTVRLRPGFFTSGTPVDDIRFGTSPSRFCDGYAGTAADRNDPIECVSSRFATLATSRYALFAHSQTDAPKGSGLGRYGGDAFVISLGNFETDSATAFEQIQVAGGIADGLCSGLNCWRNVQAGTFMHELGHTLGLRHGGTDDDVEYKPNHLSVMNYSYQNPGWAGAIPGVSPPAGRPLDYGRSFSVLSETVLDEPVGISKDGLAPGDISDMARWPIVWWRQVGGRCEAAHSFPASGPIDWNNDGDTVDTSLEADLNGDTFHCASPSEVHVARPEWNALDFNHRDALPNDQPAAGAPLDEQPPIEVTQWATLDSDGDGVANPLDNCVLVVNPSQVDSDSDGAGDACPTRPASDLVITVQPRSGAVPAPGASAEITISVYNAGPDPATNASVQIQRVGTFDNVVVVSGPGSYDVASGRWTIGSIGVGQTATLVLSGTISNGGTVRAFIATLDQRDPNSSIGTPDATTAALVIGPGPGTDATWPGDAEAVGVVTSPTSITVNAGTTGFWCPIGAPTQVNDYEPDPCYDVTDPGAPSTDPGIQIDNATQSHRGPGRLFTFLVSVASETNTIAGSAKAISQPVVSVPVPAGTRFVAAQVYPGINSQGPSTYDPTNGLWRLPPSTAGIATLYLTVEPLSNSPAALSARLLTYNGISSFLSDSSSVYPAFESDFRPFNDDPGNSAELVGATGSAAAVLGSATTLAPAPGATTDVELPGLPSRESVWFHWIAPSDGVFTPQLTSSFGRGVRPASMRVLRHGQATPLQEGNPIAGFRPIPVRAGDRIDLAVYSTPQSCCSSFDLPTTHTLRWTLVGPATNDDFLDATDLAGAGGLQSVNAAVTTVEPNEPAANPGPARDPCGTGTRHRRTRSSSSIDSRRATVEPTCSPAPHSAISLRSTQKCPSRPPWLRYPPASRSGSELDV